MSAAEVEAVESSAPETGSAPKALPSDGLPVWVSPLGLIVLSAALLFAAVQFLISHGRWLVPFIRDFFTWIANPQVGGSFEMPARPAAAGGLILVVATIGWLAARLLLLRADLFGERPLVVGLSMVLGISVLGYAGMLGVAFRTLTPWLLWSVLGSVGGALLFLNHRASSKRADPRDREHAAVIDVRGDPWPALRIIAVVFAVGVIALVSIHAVLGPVQEWDSVVYHAESARQWFMARPDPPVLFGPSVGIQISSNYPPLFPAAGAAIYTLIGAFDDFYLRLLSPICLVAMVLMTFGYARARFGARAASLAVLLTLGAPLLILYGTWPTGYVLLATLLLGVVILADGAAQTGATAAWVGVGAVAGLAMLSQFYGFLALPIGIAAALAFRQRRGLAIVALVATALVVAGPWLVRNFVELGDPIYPLGSPFFHGRGLIEPIWEASKDEIRLNALGYWPESSGLPLRWAQLGTALLDKHLSASGILFALIAGAGVWRRDPRMLYLAVALGGIVLFPLLPGWFWVRALIPAIPIAAILTGQMFVTAISGARRVSASAFQRSVVRSCVALAVGATLLIGGLVTVPLAISGPNQDTWTTALSDRSDLMRSVRNLGRERAQLWTTFAGDLLMWEWLNEHEREGGIATLEIRTYYLDDPGDLFLIDGRDAGPLLRLRDPGEILRFFQERGIRFIALPSWTVDGPTRHPVVGLMPFFRLLGSRSFPAIAAFATLGSEQPSVVYSVGPSTERPVIGIYPGADRSDPIVGEAALTITAGRVDPRIFVPAPTDRAAALSFEYATSEPGEFEFHLFDEVRDRWDVGMYRVQRSGAAGWNAALIPLPPTRASTVDFGVYVRGNDLHLRDLRVVYPSRPILQASQQPMPEVRSGPQLFTTGSDRGRIYIPVRRAGTVTFRLSYLDRGRGSFDINVRDPVTGEWETGVEVYRLEDTGAWREATVTFASAIPGFVEIGIHVRDVDLLVKRAELVPTG
jgi:4-amino-4-deoxy-L-arabinose transferase-like glycosyltransferase